MDEEACGKYILIKNVSHKIRPNVERNLYVLNKLYVCICSSYWNHVKHIQSHSVSYSCHDESIVSISLCNRFIDNDYVGTGQ